jgi:16S rRNA (guanine(527)-N(7))-methyltransferase RsmG
MLKIRSGDLIERYIPGGGLSRFLDEVTRANRKFNLYSRRLSRDDLLVFVAESLVPLDSGWIHDNTEEIVDIGSGWGIPAIPLLLANIDAAVTLIERSRKKADFLMLLLHRLGLKAEIICGDPVSIEAPGRFDLITLRGVAVGENLLRGLAKISKPRASLIYFGPDFPEGMFDSYQYIDYAIDTLPARRIWKGKI